MRSLLPLLMGILIIGAGRSVAQTVAGQMADGVTLSVEEGRIAVRFDTVQLGVGDEVLFIRRNEIIDPLTQRVRGATESEIARGVVEDIGIDRAYVNIIAFTGDAGEVRPGDIPRFTGREHRIVRTDRVVGRIQELLADNEMEIGLGTNDAISEGDMFLIRRTEMTYDPATNEVTGEHQFEVGRGQVSSVGPTSSRGRYELDTDIVLNLDTDGVVFESADREMEADAMPRTENDDLLVTRIADLESQVAALRATVDSLGVVHHADLATIRDESAVMVADIIGRGDGPQIRMGTDEMPMAVTAPGDLETEYRRALDACLAYRFDTAVPAFQSIIARYPESPYAENCRYWIAQSDFAREAYASAAEGFRAVIADTRFDHKDDDAAVMLGITYYLMGESAAALDEFRRFSGRYPESEYTAAVARWVDRLS